MMKQLKTQLKLMLLPAAFLLASIASIPTFAQAVPTASRSLQLSAFGAASGVFTDLEGGHNLSITAGGDLAFLSIAGFHPAVEIRGTYPIHSGTIDGQKNFLGGIRVDRQYGRLRPYVDFLAGRGEVTYENGGITIGFLRYISTTTNVYSPGAGVEFDLSPNWALKADYQYQSWKTPVVASGTIHPSVISIGVTYKFNFDHTYSRSRHPASAGEPRLP